MQSKSLPPSETTTNLQQREKFAVTLRSKKRKSLLREKRSSLFKINENEDKPASNLQNTEIVKCEIQQCLTDISDLKPNQAI